MSTWMIDTALYTGLLIAAVLALRGPVARHFGPTLAYALWLLPLLRLFLPPVELPASLAPAAEPATGQGSAALALTAGEIASASAAQPAPIEWAQAVPAAWLLSAILFLAWRTANYRAMRRALLLKAIPVGEAGKVRLVETPGVSSPLAFGLIDKVVALPPRFMAMEDRAARDLAIAHELAHHRGHDIAANFAAQLVLALHWFNPLAWAGWQAMRRDQEAACDARVMAGRDRSARADYANLLATFAAGPRRALGAPLACPILGEKSIIHRLRSLSMSDVSHHRRIAGRLLLAGAVAAIPLTASISYAQSEPGAIEAVDPAPSQAAGEPVPAKRELRIVRTPEGGADAATEIEIELEGEEVAGDAGEKRVYKMVRIVSPEHAEGHEGEMREHEAHMRKHAEMTARMAAADERMPIVEERCEDEKTGTRSWTDENGRKRVIVCERVIERQAVARAEHGLRRAREAIAQNKEMDAAIRAEILQELDSEIARLKRERSAS